MKITAIEKKSKDMYTIFVDDEYWYILHYEIIVGEHLRVGTEVSGERLEEIKTIAERRKAKERAYYLLTYRAHSANELYKKLQRSVRDEIAAETVSAMQEQGFIDDSAYAESFARQAICDKRWGGKKAYFELLKRGIDKQTAADAVKAAKEETDIVENIKTIIDRKYYHKLEDYKARQSVIAALLRQGYDFSDIKTAINEYIESNEQEDE